MLRDQKSMEAQKRNLKIRHVLIPGGRIVVRLWNERAGGGSVPAILRCDVAGYKRTRDGEDPLGVVVAPVRGFRSAQFRRQFIGDHVSTFRTWISSGEFPGMDSQYFSES